MEEEACAAVQAATEGALRDFVKDPYGAFWSADTLVVNTALMSVAVLVCWLLSLVSRTYSHVDRFWSLLPVMYVLVFAREHIGALLLGVHVPAPRLLVMSVLVVMWGSRLTYNFARKGGYDSWLAAEDYRWEFVQSLPIISHPILWQLFNLLFIAIFQNMLLLAIAAPAYLAATVGLGVALGPLDIAAAALATACICGEAVADQQQWDFQCEKHYRRQHAIPLTGDYKRGFLASTGLWRYSRHPNFFCEQVLWWSFYLFGVSASRGCWLNVTIAGPLALTLLFQGSCWLTERISADKYSEYKRYQASTSMLIPCLPGTPL